MTGPIVPVQPLIAPGKLEAMLADGTDWEVRPVAYPPSEQGSPGVPLGCMGAHGMHADGAPPMHGGVSADGIQGAGDGMVQSSSILGFVERSQLERLLVLYKSLKDGGGLPDDLPEAGAAVGEGGGAHGRAIVVSLLANDSGEPPAATGLGEVSHVGATGKLGPDGAAQPLSDGHEEGTGKGGDGMGAPPKPGIVLKRSSTTKCEGALAPRVAIEERLAFKPLLDVHQELDEGPGIGGQQLQAHHGADAAAAADRGHARDAGGDAFRGHMHDVESRRTEWPQGASDEQPGSPAGRQYATSAQHAARVAQRKLSAKLSVRHPSQESVGEDVRHGEAPRRRSFQLSPTKRVTVGRQDSRALLRLDSTGADAT